MTASHTRATAAGRADSTGITWLLLKPILVLAFALLHLVYQAVLLVHHATSAIKSAATKRHPTQPPASFTCLEELLAAHKCPADAVRIPQHLAVVLVDAQPSPIRLYLSRLFSRTRRGGSTPTADVWHEFRSQFQTAVVAKHCSDVAALIHLARISGVQQLSIYTSQPLDTSALQSVRRTLQTGYRTRAIVLEEDQDQVVATSVLDTGSSWSRYDELRRRRRNKDASSDSSPASPASSDSEATPSWFDDETLASSYTAEQSDALLHDASVRIRIGLDSNLNESAGETALGSASLQVTLLSQVDGQQRFASLISDEIRSRCSAYLSTTVLADIGSCLGASTRISASTLRKSWMATRSTLTSQLSVAALDAALSDAGYVAQPDLLVVFGSPAARVRQLHGFPAWPLRVTDLYYGDSGGRQAGGYASGDFVAALCKLGKMEQRYGR